MSENRWDLLDPAGDEALDLGQGNQRGHMCHEGIQGNVKRWKCQKNVGSFVWTAKGTKDYSGRGEEIKQSNSQIIFLDEGRNISYTDNQIGRLCYSDGFGERISSFECERGLIEVHGIQVQRESVLLRRPTFWLEPESIVILYGDEVNSQSDQREVQRQNGTIHGRPTDLITVEQITKAEHSYDNSVRKRARLKDAASQMKHKRNERHSISWLEMDDLYYGSVHSPGQQIVIEIETVKMVRDYDGEEGGEGQMTSTAARRVELLEIAGNGCISTYGIDQSSKNGGVEET
ncbi:MAG: hypothetical protein EZS28_046525, partial [Streblomastix strix]